jgi:hypothetical protein
LGETGLLAMPIIFVHGVNTRKGEAGYKARLLLIKKFLQKYLASAKINGKVLPTADVRFPYWGDLGTQFAWNMASLPSGQINALGASGVEDDLRPLIAIIQDGLVDSTSAMREPLLGLSRKSLALGVQVLSDLLLQSANEEDSERIAHFLVTVQAYAELNPQPEWLHQVTTDSQLINRLAVESTSALDIGEVQALGMLDFIINPLSAAATRFKGAAISAATTVLDRTGDFASTKLLAWGRRPLNGILGRFFGDVFTYLDARGNKDSPGAIPKRILAEIDIAQSLEGPVVVIGHSLGGVICFDLFSHFRPDLVIDLFISVGSQVSHFEEIKRFKSSDASIPSPQQRLAKTPDNIKQWINVFDEVDIFSYACEKVFDRVADFHYDTQTYTIKAHGAYFEQDRFYTRLRARIDQLP